MSHSLSLIKFWGTDADYDGGIPKIDKLFDSGERKIQIKNNNNVKRIAVIGYNVFGGRFTARIDLK